MYHGTPSLENAALIEQNGFRASRGGLLGPGVYVSRDFKKAEQYGGRGVIFEVLVRVGKVCHIEDHEVPIPVGRMLTAGVAQQMVPARTLHPQGWSTAALWSDNGYDTAWVQASCPDHVFTGGAGWGQGIKEETCVFEASRVTVQRRFKWDTDRRDVSSIEWLFEEDRDRVSGHDRTHGQFVPFSRRNSIMLESHHLVFADKSKGGKEQVVLTIESERKIYHQHTGFQYEVDLVRMKQRNVMTGFERRLLRRDSSRYASMVLQSAVRIWLAKKQVEELRQRLQRRRDDLKRYGAACYLQRVWRACERNKAKPIVLESDEQELETGQCVARALCRLAVLSVI